jgi:hypothetical protein
MSIIVLDVWIKAVIQEQFNHPKIRLIYGRMEGGSAQGIPGVHVNT